MKIRLFILLAAMAFAPVNFAAAQDDYSAVEELAPEAGGQGVDAEIGGDYAAEGAIDGEDASWAAGVEFDGSASSGEVVDPSTLEPAPFSASPNDE